MDVSELDRAVVDELLNFELIPGEEYIATPPAKGTLETERAIFTDITSSLAGLSRGIANEKREGVQGRAFHFKPHGCLTGKLTLFDQVPKEAKIGLFSKAGTYDIIARISNGMGWAQHDAKPDLRSMTLKVFVNGQTIDWTLMNGPIPMARDILQFKPFMLANFAGPLHVLHFAIDQKKADPVEVDYFRNFARSTFGAIESMLEERYWSQHPYVFGKESFMKINAFPKEWTEAQKSASASRGESISPQDAIRTIGEDLFHALSRPATYLREDLVQRVAQAPIKYSLAIQLYQDKKSTPVENSLIEWTEAISPSIIVGEIEFDQQVITHPGREAECTHLKFTPANFYTDPDTHTTTRPAGSLGRGRLMTYKMGQILRNAQVAEPDAGIVERWRAHRYTATQN